MRMFTSCQENSLYFYEPTRTEMCIEGKTVIVYGVSIYKDGCKHSHSLSDCCTIEDVSDELPYVEYLLRVLRDGCVMPLHAEQIITELLCEYPAHCN